MTIGFAGHAHSHQRFTAPVGGSRPIPREAEARASIRSGPEPVAAARSTPTDSGWNNTTGLGSACGSAPVPATRDRVYHFLLVSVNGSQVTVTPTDELGRTFDPVTYTAQQQNADLSLTKSDSPDPVNAGQLLTYTLTVNNQGPSTAIGTQLTDTLPAGTTFDSATPSQGSCAEAAGTVDCSLATIASGAGATVQITVRPQAAGSITNNASVSSSVNDPSSSNNSASASTTVNPAADLSLTKTDSPDPIPVGQLLTYTLTVNNAGPSSATGVVVTDNLSPDTIFNSATPSQGSCSQSSGTVTCSLGTVASGASPTIDIKVTPQSSGSITNQASVGSGVFDPDSSNNGASADTTVNPSAGLSLSKDDAPDPVLVGQLLTYTLTARNAGPLSATGVQVSDTLPAGVTFDSATPSQGTCSESSGTVNCDLGTLAASQNVTIDVKVRPQSTGSITNQATLTSATFDPDLSDNSASADTTVDPAADLSLTKTDSPDPVLAGEPITYTLTANNAGPSGRDRRAGRRQPPGRRDVRFGDALPGKLLRGRRHRDLCARVARLRQQRDRRDRCEPRGHRLDHQPGERHLRRRRSQLRRQQRERRHDDQPGGRPLDHEDGRARPGPGGHRPHLRARGREHRAAEREPAFRVTDNLPPA